MYNHLTMKENKIQSETNNPILDAENITSIIKEETKSSLKTLLNSAIKEYMNESIIKEADKDDDYEVEDVDDKTVDDDTDKKSEDTDTAELNIDDVDNEKTDDNDLDTSDTDTESELTDTESSDANDLGDTEDKNDDEWSEFEQYKTDDGYDLTGVEDDDTIVKVYKLLNDDDQVVVKKDNDKINIKDNETGAEYVIEVDPEIDTDSMDDSMDDDSMNEETDLGYTDNYQHVDPLANTNMSEPAKTSSTNSWDEGVPTDTKKPWAGKGNMAPYTDNISEEDMGTDDEIVDEITTTTSNNARKMPKTHTSEPRKANLPYGSKHISAAGKYDDSVVEKILKKAKAIQEENKKYKKYLSEIKKHLHEAAVVNVSLGQIVKLFTENTTSNKEKKNIIERFSNVTSVNESKALYETISHELNNTQKSNVVIERQMSATSSNKLNETPVYQSNDIKEALDLMRRVAKC